jgi:DNA (cytosine-5)-methyltransferase 1
VTTMAIAMDELIVDSFAGGGGASLGIHWALGRSPDIAINHNPAAIAMHEANHPDTLHFSEDVFQVSPRSVTNGKQVGLLWASPDCRHFSRAKGSKPVEKSIRGLAWVVIKWAEQVAPRVVILENVREFQEWGPVVPRWECRECKWRGTDGQTVLVRKRPACPSCESRKINPTEDMIPCPRRKGLTFRKFIGRLKNLGYQVEWRVLNAADYGAPTHRRRLFLVARNDGEPIAWPEPTHGDPKSVGEPSLFAKLQPWRTAAECIDWSIPCPSIFGRKKDLAEKTLARIAKGIKRYVLDNPQPFIVHLTHAGERRGHPTDEPLPTITGANRGEMALVSPLVVNLAHGDSADGRCRGLRANSIGGPLGTIHAGGGSFAVVAAFLAKHFGGVVGVPIDTPLPTTTTRGTQNQIVAVNLIHLNHGDKQWSGADEPLRTQTTANHAGLVYAFLTKYFGNDIGSSLNAPAPTSTSHEHFGLVTVQVSGEPYVIVDIGMRMLKPRELARAQGFPDSYVLTGSASHQVERIGNSVCPHVAAAVVRANCVLEAVSK